MTTFSSSFSESGAWTSAEARSSIRSKRYVEYVTRHKRELVPHPPPLRLGHVELDAISLPDPDMSVYDDLSNDADDTGSRRAARPLRQRQRGLAVKKNDEDGTTPSDDLELLVQKLRRLRLPGMPELVASILERAAKENLSTTDVVHRLCDEEKLSRIRSAVDRRLRDARFP